MHDPTTSTEPLPPSMQDDQYDQSRSKSGDQATTSRLSGTSQAWVEVSSSPSSAEDLSPPASGSGFSSEEMMSVPRSSNRVGKAVSEPVPKDSSTSGRNAGDLDATKGRKSGPASRTQIGRPNARSQSHQTPPSQPPSLTLSLFTKPSHLTFSRIVAVLGINLVLPFINGVMLGFGEIFAREAVKVGKIWWTEGNSFFRSSDSGSDDRIRLERGRDDSSAGGRGIAGVGLSGSGGFP